MLNWLSRYSYKYPKSLVYMLQASEYNFSDFIDWYKQTENFNNVEKRKSLTFTPKATGLLIITWLMLIGLYVLGIFTFFSYEPPNNYPGLVFIFFGPFILPYLLIVKTAVIQFFIQKPIEYFALKKTKKILKEHKALKIAIAGSYGKTSMREILKTILETDKTVASPPDSYNTPLGISKFVKNLKGDEEIIIFEFGEYYPGDIKKLAKIVKPGIGIITGINEAHLKKFKSLQSTINTIYELKDFVKPKNLYINGDSVPARMNAPKEANIYSKKGIEHWEVKDSETDLNGLKFKIDTGKEEISLESKLLGFHQLGPLVVSCFIAQQLNISFEKIKEGVKNTKSFDHRLQPKEIEEGVTLIDDSYNGNPDGVTAAINFLSSLKNNRKIYITPGLVEMGPKTKEIHINIGKQLAQAKIDKVILIKNSVTPYIEQGLKENQFKGEIVWFENGPKAFNALKNITIKGDVVLIQNDWPDQYK